MERKVKIVCTLGPASLNHDTLGAMIDAGMNVARLNFSHGTQDSHLEAVKLLRSVAKEKGRDIAVLLDTKGPEIRTTLLQDDNPVLLKSGETIELRPDDGSRGCAQWVCVTHKTLAQECVLGQDIFIDDGSIHLKVREIRGPVLVCDIIVGGTLSNRKGVNIPGANISLPTLSDRDKSDILWGVKNDVDFIAISFVRNRSDVLAVRHVVEEAGGNIKLISKIESRGAVDRIEEIAEVSDGMMIARGDLGVEIPTEDVPLVQKQIIDLCRREGKQTIVATQMLDSMIRNPRPTRAEANDVANAVLDGTDAVMLSGESAAGKYPVRAVETMAKIVLKAETALGRWGRAHDIAADVHSIPDAVSMAAVRIARRLNARAIVCLTRSGSTARMVSKYRPECPIIAVASAEKACRLMNVVWGVHSVYSPQVETEDLLINNAVMAVVRAGYAEEGDTLVITAGLPLGTSGTTNMIRVYTIGHVVARGTPVFPGVVTGHAFNASSDSDTSAMDKGDILIVSDLDAKLADALPKASAIIATADGHTNAAAVAAIEARIPCIVGAKKAFDIETGTTVTVNGRTGLVYKGVVNAGA